jgi:HEPN domain-containing protein
MQPSQQRADEPRRWQQLARADLAIAKVPLPPGGMYEQLCFHAQQAAEKSIKAVLLNLGVNFPFTHNLQALVDLIPAGLSLPPVLVEAVNLNPYAVITRYPTVTEPVTEEDYLEAVRIAEDVVAWAEAVI